LFAAISHFRSMIRSSHSTVKWRISCVITSDCSKRWIDWWSGALKAGKDNN